MRDYLTLVEKMELLDDENGAIRILPIRPALLLLSDLIDLLLLLLDDSSGSGCTGFSFSGFSGAAWARLPHFVQPQRAGAQQPWFGG